MPTGVLQLIIAFWAALSFFLAALFWALYRRLERKRSFLFWAWAWAAYGVFWGGSAIDFGLADQAALRNVLWFLETLAGYARIPLLAFGAWSFARADRLEPPRYRLGIVLALILGATSFGVSLATELPLAGGYVRNAPRVLLTGAALCYVAAVFLGRWRAARSRAALVTAAATGLGGVTDLVYASGVVLFVVGGGAVTAAPAALSMEGVVYWTSLEYLSGLGTALGMVYLLLEEHELATQQLGRQRGFLRQVLDVIPSFIFAKDKDLRYALVNRAFAETYGSSVEALVGRTDAEIHAQAADVGEFARADREVLSSGRDLFIPEMVSAGRDGRRRWSQVIKRPMTASDGAPMVLGVATDITARKEAELRQSAVYRIAQAADQAEQLDELFRSVHEIVRDVMSARNLYIALVDDEQVVSFPYWVDERDPPPPARAGGLGLTEYVLRTGKPLLCTTADHEALAERGEAVYTGSASKEWVGVPLVAGSTTLGVMAVQDYVDPHAYGERDLEVLEFVSSQVAKAMDRKRVEAARARLQADVQRSALEWRSTFDSIASPILILDLEGRVLRLNQAAKQLAQQPWSELIGVPAVRIATGEPWRRIAELATFVGSARAASSSEVRDPAAGRTWEVSASLLAVRGERAERVIIVARDITRLVQLQDSLRRSETMSAMGALVAGVAHEVRNPLFSMTATLDAFEARYEVKHEYQKHLDVLRTQLGRLTELMQELLDYGKPPLLHLVPLSLDEIFAQALETCARSATEAHVSLLRGAPTGVPSLPMDRLRMVQVFANLIENAIQHSPPGGTVRIDAELLTAGGRPWVECAVTDAGPGFTDEDLPRLFEPFFTRRRGGTGLGLSLVQRIVEQHGGQVRAENRPRGGAVIRVRLPLSAADA